MTHKTTPHSFHESFLNTCRKIWQKVRKQFRRKAEIPKTIERIRAAKREIEAGAFGNASEAAIKIANSHLRFNRWKLFVGGDIARFLRIPEPLYSKRCDLLAQYLDIDLEKEIQLTDKAWVLDGITALA